MSALESLIASLICEADKLIAAGVDADLAARRLGVPPTMMQHWRQRIAEPHPKPAAPPNPVRTLGADHWSDGLRIIRAVRSEVGAVPEVLPPNFDIARCKPVSQQLKT